MSGRLVDFTEVRSRIGGIKGVMRKLGDAPAFDHKWKSMESCPFCGRDGKGKAGVFTKGGVDFFKCFNPGCSSGGAVLAETGYIAARLGLSDQKPAKGPSPAYQKLLELAGCWEEPQSSTPPHPAPSSVPVPAEEPAAEPEPEPGAWESAQSVPRGALSDVEQNFSPAKGDPASEQPLAPANTPAPVQADLAAADAPTTGGAQVESAAADALPEERKNLDSSPAPSAESGLPTGSSNAPESNSSAPAADNIVPVDFVDLPLPLRALRRFYEALAWTDADATALTAKRGLTALTAQLLGFRSNPRANEDVLLSLVEEFGWEVLCEAGLALPEDRRKPLRLNQQFFGKGIAGRKAEAERRHKEDKWTWGWTHPVIIPYFDERGQVVKLRPHKGGAPGDTLAGAQRIYVPRVLNEKAQERFDWVVVCEGEFKAAAVWQVLGAGSIRNGFPVAGATVGVCALPGISFTRSEDMRAELDEWLRAVRCQRVVVAFDDEDKADKELEKRYDAQIYARYLAQDLTRKIGVRGEVLMLPREWRDAKGKADWDGALAKLISEGGRHAK